MMETYLYTSSKRFFISLTSSCFLPRQKRKGGYCIGIYTLSNVFTNLSPTSRVRKFVQAY